MSKAENKRCKHCWNFTNGSCSMCGILERFCIANGKFHFYPNDGRLKMVVAAVKSDSIRGLCLKEPWASMVANGRKTIETRTWKTKYRGPVLLCASKKPPGPLAGQAFMVVQLKDCRPMTPADEEAAGGVKCEPGRYAWEIKKIMDIKPFAIKGKLGLFKLDENEIIKALVKIVYEVHKNGGYHG